MARPPRDFSPSTSQTYFLTASCWGGRPILQSERMSYLLLDTLDSYRRQGKFTLHEFVIMPNHLHLLLSLTPGITLQRTVQFIKGGFSFRVGKELGLKSEIWQRGYVDHRIRDSADYAKHREYIFSNPVRKHLALAPQSFLFSSANGSYSLDPAPRGLKPI